MRDRTISYLAIGILSAIMTAGCSKEPQPEPVKPLAGDAVQSAGDTLKDSTKAVEHTAEKAWEGIKKTAGEASHVATNVASQVKAESEKAAEKVKTIGK